MTESPQENQVAKIDLNAATSIGRDEPNCGGDMFTEEEVIDAKFTIENDIKKVATEKDRAKFEENRTSPRYLKGFAAKNARYNNQIVIKPEDDKQTMPNKPCPCNSGKKYKKCCQYYR